MKKNAWTFALATTTALLSNQAMAHVSITSGPAIANQRNIIEISVPHGCEGFDSVRIEIDIPTSLSSIRPIDSVFGPASIVSQNDAITKIVWAKPTSAILDSDTHYYQVSFRATLPDTPFTLMALPTTQYCLDDSGNEISVSWSDPVSEHGSHDSSSHPSPSMMLLPERHPGWNQYQTSEGMHLHDMSIFDDAEIVWWNNAAYSSNPSVINMIQNDSNYSVLEEIHDNASFWVKY